VTAGRAQRALLGAQNQSDVNDLQWAGDVAVLHDESQPDPALLASRLSAQSDVEFAHPNFIRRPHALPNDPDFTFRQWNFNAIGMPKAWDVNFGATSSTIVALVDTGVTVVPAQNLFLKTYAGSSIATFAIPVGPSPDIDPAR